MADKQNVYAIFGLRKGASDEEIKQAYVELIRKYDPEKHTDRFMVIQTAYEKLRHPERKAREDILIYNFIRGKFLFAEEERAREDAETLKNQMEEAQKAYQADTSQDGAKQAYIQARMRHSFRMVEKRLWNEALQDWKAILDMDPSFQRAKSNMLYSLITLGYSYAEHELHAEALDLWEKAARINPDNTDLIHNLAICCERAGQREKAQKYWNEVLRRWQALLDKDPENRYTRYLLVEARRHLGELSENADATGGPVEKKTPRSIEDYKEILKLNPDDFEALYKMAMALYKEHRWKEAIEAWQSLLKKFPKNIEALNLMGWSLLNAGRIEQAFQTWNRSLAIDPKNHSTSEAIIKARMSVGRAFRKRGMYTQSLVHFKALLRFTPKSSEVYMEIGETYMLKGDKRSAAQAFKQVISLDPKNREARQRLSDMKLRV